MPNCRACGPDTTPTLRRETSGPLLLSARPLTEHSIRAPPSQQMPNRGVVGGKNFSLARSPTGVAIVDAWSARGCVAT
eukprot:143305-Pleurochrysis_carterae.AAC.4